MTIRIKDWDSFQHFKDRRPPWVKLYRGLLDDLEWHELDPKAAKVLVSLWLIASEFDGELPVMKKLAFRLRMTEKDTLDVIFKLSHWLEHDDINAISDARQDDIPETETETETETDGVSVLFTKFWERYPSKKAKPAALRAFKAAKITGDLNRVLSHISEMMTSDDWVKQNGKYIPYPATYLNQRRWEDGGDDAAQPGLANFGAYV